MITVLIFQLIVLLFSVIIHEVSHGFVAEHLGDPTARNAGRLTLNPLSHLDPFGSFLVPLLLWILTSGSFVFGWAKPVPYNPSNLKNPMSGAAKIAAAGPLSNLLIATVFGIIFRVVFVLGFLSQFLVTLFSIVIYLNILLAVFNLVPIPPLDGSKILFAIMPRGELSYKLAFFLERYGMMLVLLFVFFGFQLIMPIINFLFAIIAGQSFRF